MKDLTVTRNHLGNLAASETLASLEKSIELERAGVPVYMMSVGEPDFDTPEPIKAACVKALMEGKTKYTVPAGIWELREALAAKLRASGAAAAPEQIIVTPGGKFANAAAITALCGPGDEVLLPAPYWVSHLHMIRASGATPVVVPTRPEENFEPTEADLRRYVTDRTRLAILCSPSNPTGAVWRRAALERLAECALRRNFMVLSDEVYEQLVYDAERPHLPFAALGTEVAEHTVTVNSFSKSHAMTGWRVGSACAPRWLAAKIDALQTHFVANVTTFAQYGALYALEHGAAATADMRAAFARRRELICRRLAEIPGLRFTRSSGAFYVFADISAFGLDDPTFCERLMDEHRVAVAPGGGFGAPGFIRISYACSEAVIEAAVAELKKFCAATRR